ncbi:hypothetical protein ACROYT_G034389 [Oculina patagonica]
MYLLLPLVLVIQLVESASLGGDITVNTTLTVNGSAYVVSQDLVVAENATLTIQPGVQLHFDVGVALKVKGSLQAKGNSRQRIVFSKIPTNISVDVDDLKVTAPYYNDGIRLSGGKNYRVGRLEIFVRGQWGTVCLDSFDIKDAQVACRQLGFLGAKRFYTHGGGTGPTWLDEVDCKGTEESLLMCRHPGIGVENCDHWRDIGIECHSLAKLLSTKVYWKGIDFSESKKTSSLQYVEVFQAYEAIKGSEVIPDLGHVTVKSSVYGVKSDNITSPLTISNSSVRDNLVAGIQIKGKSKAINIKNTAVDNTTYGDGFSYSEAVPDPVDFCSSDVNVTRFPVFFEALGKTRTNVDCAKIIRTQPGSCLTVYYQSVTGEKFFLEVFDGNTRNATMLTSLTEQTGVNQAVTPSSSSGHELYIRFRYNAGRKDARVKFLITDDQEPDGQQQISVNDSIIGRRSHPFIAKVVKSHVTKDFMLIEVLQVQSVLNGTAVTIVSLDQLHKEHRRHKRDILNKKITFSKSRQTEAKLSLRNGYINIKETFTMYADFIISMGMFTRRDNNGNLKAKDALIGLEMVGKATYDAEVTLGIEASKQHHFHKKRSIVDPVQLGRTFCIRINFLCIPCAFFFDLYFQTTGNVVGRAYVTTTLKSSARLRMGGSCTLFGGCQIIKPDYEIERRIVKKQPNVQFEVSVESRFAPRVTLRVPSLPKFLKKMVNKFNKLFKKILGLNNGISSSTGDYSILRLSIEAPYIVKLTYATCVDECLKKNSRKPNELSIEGGFLELVGKVEIGFGKVNYELGALTAKLHGFGDKKSTCLPCGNSKPACGCPTTPPPTTTGSTTVTSTGTTGSTATSPTPTPTATPTPTPTPPPCECADGKKGFIDETGNCNCPPYFLPTVLSYLTLRECPNGKKPVIVNSRYECPDHPPCGEPPNCVVGRKGPGCSQPDVQPCSADCSGNGVPVATSDCGSRCACSGRWTGTCCDRRLPQRNWGDPHLETLDGIEYDYFGIGEFWGCKSLFNDFGMQFRFFAYQRASLTGGVALKAGQSVLAIMTVNTSDNQEFPKLRIDGRLINLTAYVGQKMKLSNGTVVMDIQKTFSSQSDETGIVLISLQYASGLTITTDVRHSHVMGRQYLNVLFTPTAAFKGHTEGLCGVMDNDPSNDLKGPNGQQYNDPIPFADSWRITAVHNNSGLRGTWSWNSSNFHSDDVMDSSYNDPNFVPVYSLEGISDVIIAKATAACSSLGLTDAMLKSCIYDVAVTNDTSLSDQETLKQGNCTDCSAEHGKCVKGFCECEDGWEGVTCEQKATCFNVNNCTSPTHGICQRTDQCRCHDGYIGRDCTIVPTCSNVSDCSGRGICIDYDVCKCQKEWTGADCTQFSCGSLDHCSGHGRCVALYECNCEPGWTGVSCALPDCAGVNQCSGQGECVSSDTCQCYPGFQGVNCSDVVDCGSLGNCSGNGVCMQEKGGNLTCRCFAGFSGVNCSVASCLLVNNCSGHGQCLEADFCKCDVGYTGIDCLNASCEGVNYCSGHGVCTGYDTCACDPLWHGPACSEADCSDLNHCSNKGDCILPNTCECYPGYDGAACNTTAKPNLHAPSFAAPFYNASMLENSPIGTKILRVQASDADSGRNAQLLFLLDDGNDASPAFTIDSVSGEIFTSSALDYESSSPRLFKLKIVVSDNGTPRKSSFVFMYVHIVDVNDNCPVFNSLHTKWFNISQNTHPGTFLTVVSATDQDSGLNGEVRYSLSYASNLDGAFRVGEKSGELMVVGKLKEKEYRLVIIARDLGTPSCSRQIDVTVNVFAESAVTKTPREITTVVNTEADKSTSTVSTKADTTKFPASAPTKDWYKKPMIIMGFSIGGFFLFVFILLILAILSRKWKRKINVAIDYHAPSRLAAMPGSFVNYRPSTSEGGVVEDMEMEDLKNVSR